MVANKAALAALPGDPGQLEAVLGNAELAGLALDDAAGLGKLNRQLAARTGAILPLVSVPNSFCALINNAGVVVNAAKAVFSVNPYCTAFRTFFSRSFLFSKPAEVKQNCMPAFSK